MISSALISLLLSESMPAKPGIEIESISQWKKDIFANLEKYGTSLEMAIAGGYLSDRMAYVFLSGYQAALHSNFPVLTAGKLGAFCVSEEGGNRPKAILTSMQPVSEGYVLNGSKTFVTCAEEADELLVAACDSTADVNGRPQIKILHVQANVDGALIHEDKTLPFMPELKRGRLTLDGCMCSSSSLLSGDGYADYIKPFSPLEAFYVMAAGVGHMIRLARMYDWPNSFIEQCLAVLVSIQGANFDEPEAPENQLLINGLRETTKGLVGATEATSFWAHADAEIQKRWLRDKVMLMMPDRAHSIRLERAWQGFRSN